jgi:hypothetical protein
MAPVVVAANFMGDSRRRCLDPALRNNTSPLAPLEPGPLTCCHPWVSLGMHVATGEQRASIAPFCPDSVLSARLLCDVNASEAPRLAWVQPRTAPGRNHAVPMVEPRFLERIGIAA